MRNSKLVAYLVLLLFVFVACNKEDIEPNSSNSEFVNGESEIGGEITLYEVNGDRLTKLKDYEVSGANRDFQKDQQKHDQIWELVKKIIPLSHRDKLGKLLIYSGGESQTAGFVDPVSSDLSKWRMGIAIDYAYEGGFNARKELSYTIIHEFGHILTLNNAQVNASISENDCNGFYIQEGCAKSDSYLNNLYKNFWSDIYGEFQEKHNNGQKRMDEFYGKYKDRFVTEYASTNLVEDFAEVFAFFVTMDNRPAGNSIANRKVLMLYQYPELVALRDQIRRGTDDRSAQGVDFLPRPGEWRNVHKH